MTQNQPEKLKKWIWLLFKVALLFVVLGYYKYWGSIIMESSSFGATVFIYFHFILFCFVITWILKKLGVERYREVLFSCIVLILLLLSTEAALRFVVKTHLDYLETSGSPYRANMFGQKTDPSMSSHSPFDTLWTSKSEFSYYRVVNEKGLYEKSIPEKEPEEIRFLCLGDSFTEGVGTEYDSSWVKHVERLMQQNHPSAKITFINAGIGGNDPFGELNLFTRKLLDYQPDWVLMVTNNSDIYDYMDRGGMERYNDDGTLISRKGPWWYSAYRYSYIVRHIVHDVFKLNSFFYTKSEEKELIANAIEGISSVCKTMDSLGKAKHFNFAIILQPVFHEVEHERYTYKNFTQLNGISNYSLDLLPKMIEQVKNLPANTPYYWPLDAHYNALGYQFMGNAIYGYLDSISSLEKIDTNRTQTYATPQQ